MQQPVTAGSQGSIYPTTFTDCRGVPDLDALSVGNNARRAWRPDSADRVQPLFEHGAEAPRPAVLHATQLTGEPKIPKDRYSIRALGRKTAIAEPHVEVENGRCRCKELDGL